VEHGGDRPASVNMRLRSSGGRCGSEQEWMSFSPGQCRTRPTVFPPVQLIRNSALGFESTRRVLEMGNVTWRVSVGRPDGTVPLGLKRSR
jgi:hypothetical protein